MANAHLDQTVTQDVWLNEWTGMLQTLPPQAPHQEVRLVFTRKGGSIDLSSYRLEARQ